MVTVGRLGQRVALITGATSGIGRAAAVLFAAEGARVIAAGRDPGRLDEVLAAISRSGGESEGVLMDVTRPESIRTAVNQAVGHIGGLDIVFSCAGTAAFGTAETMKADEWDLVIATNLSAHFYVAKHTIPAMRARGGGSLILAASELGIVGAHATVAYCAAKGGVINMVRALAIDVARDAIRVNAIAPGATSTPMLEAGFAASESPAEARARQLAPIPLGRFATPEEMASAALFLASDDASYITGTTLVVDGGVTTGYGL